MATRRPSLALLLPVLAACSAAPMDPGGEADAAGGEVDARADAMGGPDAAVCDLPSGSVAGNVVRVVYLVPADRDPDERHVRALETAIRHVQLWFRDRTDGELTFEVFDPVVETRRLPQPASYYPNNDAGSEQLDWFWHNVNRDAFEVTGGGYSDEQNLWLHYIPVDPACGQRTGAAAGVAQFPASHMRGLVGDPQVRICPDDDGMDPGRCRWVGGMASLLGISIGVNPPPSPWTYPSGEIAPAAQEILADSPFFSTRALPECALDCSQSP